MLKAVTGIASLSLMAILCAGCFVPVTAPRPSAQQADQMPARIDAMFTSRFEVVRDGPLLDRAQGMLDRVVSEAGLAEAPFLRVLESIRPAAYSNGGSIVYVTTGAILLANDAQLFMMLAHEVAHLETNQLPETQYEKALIRSAERMAQRAREERDDDTACGSESDDDAFATLPGLDTTDGDEPGALTSIGQEVLCNIGRTAVLIVVESSAEAQRSAAQERWLGIENQMDQRAVELGEAAGFDRAELMSTFNLLAGNADGVPFLVERTRRLSTILGVERVGTRIPRGTAPVELAPQFDGEALDVLHAIARDQRMIPEDRIARIQRQAARMLPIYANSPKFLRGYYSYLIGYGGVIGIDPSAMRQAIDGLAALPRNRTAEPSEIWFGCEGLLLSASIAPDLSKLKQYSDSELGTAVRRVLLGDEHSERVNQCA